MVVAVVGTITFFSLVGYLSAKTFGLIKTWLEGKNSSIPEKEFNKLARAFVDYKKESQRRIKNLEAIVADEDQSKKTHTEDAPAQIDAPKENIEIEEPRQASDQSKTVDNNGNLRNMLRE